VVQDAQHWEIGTPLVVTLASEHHAAVVAGELGALGAVDLKRDGASWHVSVRRVPSDAIVVQVLDAVRAALRGDPGASALVRLDGREYHMNGEA
jgi:hypothetical protein